MLGPYDYTPPVYCYTNKHLGGAYGFNTETCPGANVPPLESIKKMIPEEHLWPVDEVWNYHCALYEFSTLDLFREAIEKRYGSSENVEDFARKAQVLNYELMRPMFEAFQANKGKATGIIQWMLNSAWPAMFWQLYDYYLMPSGATYGTKTGSKPVNIVYNYGDKGIYVINDTFSSFENISAIIRVLNIDSKEVFKKNIQISIEENISQKILDMPEIEGLSSTYFVDLELIDANSKKLCKAVSV